MKANEINLSILAYWFSQQIMIWFYTFLFVKN